MDASAYTALRARCIAEHPIWEQVADTAKQQLESALRVAGIAADFAARAKDTDSLLRKMVFKYQTDDLTRVTDKAAVRVVVYLPSEVGTTCEIVRELFDVIREEDVADRYEADQFGYRGVHFDARLADLNLDATQVIGDLACEIQVRTVAEHAWSVLSHLLTYKSPGEDSIPKGMRRRINRLVAIVELFDQEACAAQAEITERPEYAMQKLAYDLERVHNRTVGDLLHSLRRCEPELIEFLAPLYFGEGAPSERMERFAAENAHRLRDIVANYDDAISPIVRQPEAFVLWERLDNDAVAVVRHWVENVATVWGVDLPDL